MESKKKTKNITHENDELKNEIYDQDIGHEYRIVIKEIEYKEATDISTIKAPQEYVEESSKPDEIKETTYVEEKESINKPIYVEKPLNIEKQITSKKNKLKKKNIIFVFAIIILIISLIAIIVSKVKEKNAPIVKLAGEETIILKLNSEYVESGYFALDQEDGDITHQVTISGQVDTTKPGIYQIKYLVVDSDKMSNEVVRTIIVESSSNELDFKIKGLKIVVIGIDADFVEEGYTAYYNGEDISKEVKVFGKVNRSVPGTYTIIYVLAKNDEVKALKRTIIVHKGEEMDIDTELITELNNWLIDEIHYSDKITLDNVSDSALLYFAVLNCYNDKADDEKLSKCITDILSKYRDIPVSTKYQGSSADITYNGTWQVKKLDLPRSKANLYKIVVDSDNTIYLYELYAYGVALNNKEVCDGTIIKQYYSGVDCNDLIGYETCKMVNDEISRDVNRELALYVHTFKLNDDKYYWVSSEIIK